MHWTDPPRTLPTPWNTGFIGIGWVTEHFTKSGVQQGQRIVVLQIQKVPLQGFFQCSRRVCHTDFFTTRRLRLDRLATNGPRQIKITSLTVRPGSFDSPFVLSLSKDEWLTQDKRVEGERRIKALPLYCRTSSQSMIDFKGWNFIGANIQEC